MINNTFYSFGGKFVNIRDQFNAQAKNPMESEEYPSNDTAFEKVAYLNKKFKDIKMKTFMLGE